MWFTANVVSSPSSVSTRLSRMSPALLTSPSIRGSAALSRAARTRIARCEARSATNRAPSPALRRRISASARSPLSCVRHTIATRAPARASATAVSLPMPEVVPVTTQILPFIAYRLYYERSYRLRSELLRPEDRMRRRGRTIREQQPKPVPERGAGHEAAGLHEEVPRRRPAPETRLEHVGGLADHDAFGAAAQGVVELVVHQIEIEVGIAAESIVTPAEEIVGAAPVHHPPVEGDDATAVRDRGQAHPARQLTCQLVEELDRQDLELHGRPGDDGLVEAVHLGRVDAANLRRVVKLRHPQA